MVPMVGPLYSAMQSDGYSFCGYITLDSISMASKDDDSNLDQKLKS